MCILKHDIAAKFGLMKMTMLQSAEEKVPVWYIMDEFGSRVQHSSQPTCCMAPLFYTPQQIAYSVLWPLQDLENGGMHTKKCATELFQNAIHVYSI